MKAKPYPSESIDLILQQVKTSSKSIDEVACENGLNQNAEDLMWNCNPFLINKSKTLENGIYVKMKPCLKQVILA